MLPMDCYIKDKIIDVNCLGISKLYIQKSVNYNIYNINIFLAFKNSLIKIILEKKNYFKYLIIYIFFRAKSNEEP
jgi:hypothetical protein